MVTITRHIFINISQTEHFSTVKFAIGYEKNMSFLVIAKSPKVWQKGWKDRTGLLFMSDVAIEIWMICYLSKILPVEFLKIFFTYGKFTLKYYEEKNCLSQKLVSPHSSHWAFVFSCQEKYLKFCCDVAEKNEKVSQKHNKKILFNTFCQLKRIM